MKRHFFHLVTLCILIHLTLLIGQSFGQGKSRIELETTNGNCQIIPMSENGLVLFSEDKKGVINFRKYNADLIQVWHLDCQVNPSLDVIQHTYDGRFVYLLLATSKSPNYQILKVSTGAGFAEKFDIYSLNRFQISQFKARQNDAYLAGKVKNDPVILHINLTARQSRILPLVYKGTAEIQSLEVEKNTGLVNVTVLVRQGKEYGMIVKSFASEGVTARNILLSPIPDRSLLTGRLVSLNDSVQFVIGTYGLRNSLYTQGLYMTKLVDNTILSTRYYSFTDFKNFFKFMDPRDQARMEQKIRNKKQKGNDLNLQYRLLVHDVIEKDSQYLMVAEAYYPQYRARNYNNFYSGYGGFNSFGFGYPYGFNRLAYNAFGYGYPYGYGSNGQLFDGYVYTHAVVAGFGLQGDLVWDNSFEFSDVKTYTLKEKVKVNVQPDHIALVYSHDGFIKSKVIRGNEVIEGVSKSPISTEYSGDKVKKNYSDELEYWYGNYFAAWGYQKIKNNSDQHVKSSRNVFYVNKVAF